MGELVWILLKEKASSIYVLLGLQSIPNMPFLSSDGFGRKILFNVFLNSTEKNCESKFWKQKFLKKTSKFSYMNFIENLSNFVEQTCQTGSSVDLDYLKN